MKRIFLTLISILIIGLGLFMGVFGFKKISSNIYLRETGIGLPWLVGRETESQITLLAVGDIMLDRGVAELVKKEGKGDWRFPFLKLASELSQADILFGNLEGPIAEKGERVGSIYSFRTELEAVEGLKFAGFDILSLANNHILDYGRQALESTLRTLNRSNISYVGAGFSQEETFSLKVKEVRGTKVGFLAYTNEGPASWRAEGESPGIAWLDERNIENVKEYVRKIKEKREADILIVSLHSGEEYIKEPTSFQVAFGRACIEAGADLVVGHHPHIVQEVEKYKSGWIAYSLGNFIFDQGFSSETMEGLLLKIIIEDKKIKEVNPQKIKINNFFQPYLPSF